MPRWGIKIQIMKEKTKMQTARNERKCDGTWRRFSMPCNEMNAKGTFQSAKTKAKNENESFRNFKSGKVEHKYSAFNMQ